MEDLGPAAILHEFFRLSREIPAVPIGSWPTPVAQLPRLSEQLGAQIWIKRDDISAPLYGGNKVRKLELLLGQAQASNARSLVTIGGIGSHQVVATALYGRRLGLSTIALVFPQPVTPAVRQSLRLALAAGVEFVPMAGPDQLAEALESACRQAEGPCYLIPAGGSTPWGNLGYVAAALELQRQIAADQLPEPDDIVVPLGSGGTMAGLLFGLALVGSRARVMGVAAREGDGAALVRQQLAGIARLLRQLGAEIDSSPASQAVTLLEDHDGAAYGQPTAAIMRALEWAREAEGIVLEPTYTARALAALIDYCTGPGKGRRLLFWHTANSQDASGLLQGARESPLPEIIQHWLIRDAVPSEQGRRQETEA